MDFDRSENGKGSEKSDFIKQVEVFAIEKEEYCDEAYKLLEGLVKFSTMRNYAREKEAGFFTKDTINGLTIMGESVLAARAIAMTERINFKFIPSKYKYGLGKRWISQNPDFPDSVEISEKTAMYNMIFSIRLHIAEERQKVLNEMMESGRLLSMQSGVLISSLIDSEIDEYYGVSIGAMDYLCAVASKSVFPSTQDLFKYRGPATY